MVRAAVVKARARPLANASRVAAKVAKREAAEGGGPARHVAHKQEKRTKFLEKLKAGMRQPKESAANKPGSKRRKAKISGALAALGSLSDSLAEVARAQPGGGGEAGSSTGPGAEARRAFGTSLGSGRAREAVGRVEAERLQAVVAHPQFRADPLTALASHLQATAPPPLPPARPKRNGGSREKRRARRERAARGEEAMRAD